jgi:anti-sigma B factor antagonist
MTIESTPVSPPTYATVVAPAEVDLATSAALHDDIEHAMRESAWVIVDLSAVEFIDSSALSVLIRGRKLALERDGNLVLVGSAERTHKMLRITQLDRVFDLYPTADLVPPPT